MASPKPFTRLSALYQDRYWYVPSLNHLRLLKLSTLIDSEHTSRWPRILPCLSASPTPIRFRVIRSIYPLPPTPRRSVQPHVCHHLAYRRTHKRHFQPYLRCSPMWCGCPCWGSQMQGIQLGIRYRGGRVFRVVRFTYSQ